MPLKASPLSLRVAPAPAEPRPPFKITREPANSPRPLHTLPIKTGDHAKLPPPSGQSKNPNKGAGLRGTPFRPQQHTTAPGRPQQGADTSPSSPETPIH